MQLQCSAAVSVFFLFFIDVAECSRAEGIQGDATMQRKRVDVNVHVWKIGNEK